MNKFTNAIKAQNNIIFTENAHMAYKSTAFSKVLDMYGIAGAMRTRSEDEIKTKMAEAFNEDALLATRLLFYLGDIRGGLGERRTFRIALEWLAKNHPQVARLNMEYIPHFNRWDSIFVLKGTALEQDMVELVAKQLTADGLAASKGEPISLLAKWLPSVNASSKRTRALGNWFAQKLGYTPRNYRIVLSFLRDHLKVVETRMSQKMWEDINYGQVPSVAMNRYRKAFHNQDGERFREFLGKVEKGEESIKASTLYPYDIVYKMMRGERDRVLEAQWKALPNYVEGEHNVLIMADVSGSMLGQPMATSVGLAIYFAERNHGPFHNLFMTFSARPQFVELSGHDLYTKIQNAQKADWGQNTSLHAAFDKVLRVAVENKLKNEDLPKAIVVISDMEIDSATTVGQDFMKIQAKSFAKFGYDLPKLIYWNVQSRKDTFLADGNRPGVQLASGQSVSIFRNILNSIATTPYEAMLEVLNDARYECITVPDFYVRHDGRVLTAQVTTAPQAHRSLEAIRSNRAKVVKDLF